MRPTAILTGSTGFLGSNLAAMLRDKYRVVAVDRRAAAGDDQVQWDFRSPLPESLPSRADLVVHAAGADGQQAASAARDCFAVNVQAAAELLEYARGAGVRQFVYLSTGSVYGKCQGLCREKDAVAPEGVYAATKAAGEMLVRGYQHDLRTLTLRLFYPYGPGQRAERLVPRLANLIAAGEPTPLNGEEGRPIINPIYIDDAVAWVKLLLEADHTGTFNLAGAEHVSIRGLANLIGRLLAKPVGFTVHAEIDDNLIGDITEVCRTTSLFPQTNLQTGLAKMLGVAHGA